MREVEFAGDPAGRGMIKKCGAALPACKQRGRTRRKKPACGLVSAYKVYGGPPYLTCGSAGLCGIPPHR